MLGWQIFKHSFNMVIRNFGRALHIWAVPWLIAVVLLFVLAMSVGLTFETQPDDMNPFSLAVFAISMIVIVIATALWIAVDWHRFILLEETPSSILPPIHRDKMLAYLGRGFVLFLLFLVAGIVLFGLVAALSNLFPLIGIILGIVIGFGMMVVFYRLSLILPAAALGQHLTLKEALDATRGTTGTIIVIGLCLFLLELALQLVAAALSIIPLLGVLASFAVSMFLAMLGISIMTTLYGYYIEKRSLS